MNRIDQPDPSLKLQSKLFVRSEVLSVIQNLLSQVDPSKQERFKQIKRLRSIEDQQTVQEILIKELQRASTGDSMHLIAELLMEVGDIEVVGERLWELIRDPKTSDDVKDASNLILRHLGDNTDPDLYLDYLQDPQGLIARETSRMLEVSSENPETLIDFIDFILSLNTEDQVRLVSSLQRDYPSEHLVNLFVPLLESDPNPELWEQLVVNLGESKSPKAAACLEWINQWPLERVGVSGKLLSTSLKKLQLAGALRGDAAPDPTQEPLTHVTRHSLPYKCYATICDGIGNQGILFSRQRANEDVSLLCVAVNDMHGVMDCFGFYQLSETDFQRIAEKFHEGATKIEVSPEYCAYKLQQAIELNRQLFNRVPYEFQCWYPLISDIDPTGDPLKADSKPWIREHWTAETYNLYQHPDFNSWFLEPGDEPIVTDALNHTLTTVQNYLEDNDNDDKAWLFGQLEAYADQLMIKLLGTDVWKKRFIDRLTESAYLLDCQQTQTFKTLAATEAHKLRTDDDPHLLVQGFTQAYGRRCILEELLRYRTGSPFYDKLSPLVDTLIERWGF